MYDKTDYIGLLVLLILSPEDHSINSLLPLLDRLVLSLVVLRPRVDDRHVEVVKDRQQLRKADAAALGDETGRRGSNLC